MFIVSNIVCEKTSESDMDLNFTSGTWNLYILGWIISIMRLTSLIYKMSMVMPGWESVSHSAMSDSFQPMDCSLPGFSVHGISQARILEWVAICFSWGSSRPRDWACVSCLLLRQGDSLQAAHTTLNALKPPVKWTKNSPMCVTTSLGRLGRGSILKAWARPKRPHWSTLT